MFDELEDKPGLSPGLEYFGVVLRRRRWWLVLPVFVIGSITWMVSWFLPAYYKSETVILVEQQKVPEQYVVPNVGMDIQDRLQSMTQQILSRTRLLRIIEELHLYTDVRSRLSADELVAKMREDIQIDLVQAPARREDLTAFKISYSSKNPRLAQQVTNQLTSLFIDENLKDREQQSESTTAFLENQMEAARKQLSVQEQKVREFKSRYIGELPGQLQSSVQILAGLQARLQGELEALNQSRQQNLYLQSLISQYQVVREGMNKSADSKNLPPALDQELARLKTQLADVQAHYTERHPDYRKLKDQIAKVERMKEQIAATMTASSSGSQSTDEGEDRRKEDQAGNDGLHPTDLNEFREMTPMLELESQLKANKLEIDNRQKQIKELEGQIQEYEKRIDATPIREQQLADLTRDNDQSRTNYDSLLAKRNQSELATNLEKRQQGQQFRIIDPPSLPTKPYKPNRLLFDAFGLVAGIFLATGGAVLAETIDDRIRSEEELQRLVAAPVLTEIPSLPTPLEQILSQRRVRIEWLAGCLILSVITTEFLLSYYHG